MEHLKDIESFGATFKKGEDLKRFLEKLQSWIERRVFNRISKRVNFLLTRVIEQKIETVTGNTTLDDTHSMVLVDASGNITITLPTAASVFDSTTGIGKIYRIKKIDADANTVTIDPNGAELIDGGATAVLTVQWESITIQSNGTAWWII